MRDEELLCLLTELGLLGTPMLSKELYLGLGFHPQTTEVAQKH